MKHITNPDELEIGRQYWLVDKTTGNAKISQLKAEDNWKYFESRMWVNTDNNQAMELWDIYGPIPMQVPPDFEALKHGAAEKTSIELNVDDLANFIRTVDGKHDMGAGILAEHILSWLGDQGISVALVVGMPVTQEPKHGIRNNQLFNRASGEDIPFDEPVFIFRARDKIALQALYHYNSLCARYVGANNSHVHAIRLRIADFERFAHQHPDRMKFPDTVLTADFANK